MDRLSSLPEALILIIISFLPFKEAARTSVLSPDWRHRWRATKNIEFNEHDFVKNNTDAADRETQRQDFISFVQRWIETYQEIVIDKFSLTFSHPRNSPEFVQNCLTFSFARQVKHLGLDFSDPTWDLRDLGKPASFDLPWYVYGYHGLESLTLSSCNFDPSMFKNFGLLKHVSLAWLELSVSYQLSRIS